MMKTTYLLALAILPLATITQLGGGPPQSGTDSKRTESVAVAPQSGDEAVTRSAGLVEWHPSFEVACEAARASGKPVMLFQLLGRLDEEFC